MVDERRRTSPWLGLSVLMLPVLLVSVDMSVLYLAIPTLTRELGPSAAEQLWILDIYGFFIAGLLITMGTLGDRIGRRRILLVGAVLFGIASALAAFAPSPAVLIAARALMGIGGASLLPSSLSLISQLFPDPRTQAKAIGVWTAAFAGGGAAGPIIGGLLLQHFWWGSVFLINVPVVVLLVLVGPFVLPEKRSGQRESVDLWSVLLSIGAILPVVYAIKQTAAAGPSLSLCALGLFGVAVGILFIARQRRLRDPLLNLALFHHRAFSVSVTTALVGMASMLAMGYLTGIYLQSVLRLDVLTAALYGIPMAIAVFACSMLSLRVSRRFGERTTMVLSLIIAAIGNLVLLASGTDGGVPAYVVGTTVAGAGYGLAWTLISQTCIASVPEEQAGAAAGISETAFELGGAMGVALLGSLAMAIFRSGGFSDTLGETLQRHAGDPSMTAAARGSFVTGMHVATSVAGVALLVLAAVVAVVLRQSKAPESVPG